VLGQGPPGEDFEYAVDFALVEYFPILLPDEVGEPAPKVPVGQANVERGVIGDVAEDTGLPESVAVQPHPPGLDLGQEGDEGPFVAASAIRHEQALPELGWQGIGRELLENLGEICDN
jgi:hypothetical protein